MRSCLVCGSPGAALHHTLPKSVWPQHRDNPDCLVPLCFICHDGFHRCLGNVPWDMLPAATRELIESEASSDWVATWYPQRTHADLPF